MSDKEIYQIAYLCNVRLIKNVVFNYWFEDNIWLAELENTNCCFKEYTKEGLFDNIDTIIQNTYHNLIIDEIDSNEYYIDMFKEYFDLNNKTIEKKILPRYYNDIVGNLKKFEFRRNDCNYQLGDKLILKEWKDNKYTGREIESVITYINRSSELNMIYPNCIKDDYCVLGIEVMRYK